MSITVVCIVLSGPKVVAHITESDVKLPGGSM
jgi:hypothetical protein